jgi:hypothetical protein
MNLQAPRRAEDPPRLESPGLYVSLQPSLHRRRRGRTAGPLPRSRTQGLANAHGLPWTARDVDVALYWLCGLAS